MPRTAIRMAWLAAAGLSAGCATDKEVSVERRAYNDPLLDRYAGAMRGL